MEIIASDSVETFPQVPREIREEIARNENQLTIVSPQGEEMTETVLDAEHLLGKGDTSIVLKTKDGKAVKIFFNPGGTEEKTYQTIISNEIVLHQQLSHPNIAEVFGAGKIMVKNIEIPCLLKELIPYTLKEIAAEKPLSVEEGVKMIRDVSSALDFIYVQTGEVVTDLNPSNIGQRENGDWVIIDIGLTAKKGRGYAVGFDDTYSAPESKPKITNKEEPDDDRRINAESSPSSMVYSLALVYWTSVTGEEIDAMDLVMDPDNLIHPSEKIPDPVYRLLSAGVRLDSDLSFDKPSAFAAALDKALEQIAENAAP